jgi:hypothetical protein
VSTIAERDLSADDELAQYGHDRAIELLHIAAEKECCRSASKPFTQLRSTD